ncbi:MAG TPA: S4 domain-containing protein, partial [Desulfuromonadaceae bacterium]
MNHFSAIFSPENEPTRIDLFLSREMGGESRATVQRLIETGNVLVDGKQVRTSLKLKGGAQIE